MQSLYSNETFIMGKPFWSTSQPFGMQKIFMVCNVIRDPKRDRDTIQDCREQLGPKGLGVAFERSIVLTKIKSRVQWDVPGYGETLFSTVTLLILAPLVLPLGLLLGTPLPVAGAYMYRDTATQQMRVAATTGLAPDEDAFFCKAALDAANITAMPQPPQKGVFIYVWLLLSELLYIAGYIVS